MNLNNKKTYIIAEIGVNHNGSYRRAINLINLAKKSNADAVKFQIFKSEKIVTKKAELANYQKKNLPKKQSQFNLLKKLEMSYYNLKKLKKFAEKSKLDFICSAFDVESLSFLRSINLEVYKIPSGEINNYPYLKAIGRFKKKLILSTGMSNLKEIKNAIKILTLNGTKLNQISILQCNTEYPTPLKDVNLNVIFTLKEAFKKNNIGFSDHTKGIEIPMAAVSMGANIIEKHFTSSKKLAGPDHKASSDPKEFALMVKNIRNIEKAKGSYIKAITKSESKNIRNIRKSIVANKNIKKGEVFTEKNITTKRPGKGLSPMQWKNIIGKRSRFNFKEDECIKI